MFATITLSFASGFVVGGAVVNVMWIRNRRREQQ